jgi:hypothetical protein
MSPRRTTIAICTPAYGEVFYTPYVESIIRLVRACERRRWQTLFGTVSHADIVEARNFLLTYWFDKTEATHLLFVDADMGFDPQLIVEMIELDKPVVGAAYPKRSLDLKKVIEAAASGAKAERAVVEGLEFVVRSPHDDAKQLKGFIPVEGCGAGILLIQRACIERMLEVIPQLSDAKAKRNSPLARTLDRLIRAFEIVHVDGARLSEDYSFCHRWRQDCDGEIWAASHHEVTHVGLRHYKGRFSDVVKRSKPVARLTIPIRPPSGSAETNVKRRTTGRIKLSRPEKS